MASTESGQPLASQMVHATASSGLQVLCGPLLNYRRMSSPGTASAKWHGSILLVTKPTDSTPSLSLSFAGANDTSNPASDVHLQPQTFTAVKLYQDSRSAFWRFIIELPLQAFESNWEYSIAGAKHIEDGKDATLQKKKVFTVPAYHESMRIMFHSCNGFSVGTDEEAWSGCALWNDVMRQHGERPVHVMIGGGDQIYNDGIRVNGPLKPWTDIANPRKRREFPFDEDMRRKCDEYYFNNYVKWYSCAPFSYANGIIPQLNIWDDHDIIDGFGSYTDNFMRCAVFRGIGGVAHKYYMLFQHHLAPPRSTFTTDSKQTMTAVDSRDDPVQAQEHYVLKETDIDPSYIIGQKPGPYVEEKSMSVFTQLGARIAFLGIDARTERTRHQINYPETYDQVFKHVSDAIGASNGTIKHFILLLGVPIAYPRLQWLENILRSPIIGPLRLLNKRFGFAGGFFNDFDGNVDLLDDLDDHYTAHQHKGERRDLIQRLQALAKKHSVRVTILGGDVHLAAFGRFYSHPRLAVPAEHDFRYMGNIVSSAITNHPPPAAVANLLARRNKIHHLNHDTDETLLNLFDKDPGERDGSMKDRKSAASNNCTMPSRNYALISESHAHGADGSLVTATIANDPNAPSAAHMAHHNVNITREHRAASSNPRGAITGGEAGCGVEHPAASGVNRTGLAGEFGLDVTFRVEIDHGNKNGTTDGYGLSIPALDSAAYQEKTQEA